MITIESVNVGRARPTEHTSAPSGRSGIDKRPVTAPVQVTAPGGPKGTAGSGLAGDSVCDTRHHGGDDQAVYAFAREDLDRWSHELGRPLANGCFGENLTTRGLDITGALVGERWLIGGGLLLEVSDPRIPCRTFAGFLDERGWVRRFTARGAPGTYLRVIEPGPVAAGMSVEVVDRPDHDVTVGIAFRALTTEPALLPRLVGLPGLSEEARGNAARRTAG